MANDSDHNKMLQQAARAVFRDSGLFQKGQSRTWIDDNGWYLTVVEFQPSGWAKGSCLNVGIHYLWSDQDYLSFDYGYRECGFTEFSDSGDFYAAMVSLAEKALEKVTEYRRFRDLPYAKSRILEAKSPNSHTRVLYHSMMVCGLSRDTRAEVWFDRLREKPERSGGQWEPDMARELSEKIAPIIHDPVLFSGYICEKINRQRRFWRQKPTMKKLGGPFAL